MSKIFNLSLGGIRVFDTEIKDFKKIEVWAISEGENRNKSAFTEESLINAIPSVWGKPIVGYFSSTNKDFEEHNVDMKLDGKTMEWYRDLTRSDSEYPMGFVNEAKDIVEIREKDGKKWIYFTAHLWTKLNKEAIDTLLKSRRKKTSAEITVLSSHMDGDVEVIDRFVFDAMCILGNKRGTKTPVEEGIEGSHLKILSAGEHLKNFRSAVCFALESDNEDGGEDDMFHGMGLSELSKKMHKKVDEHRYESDGFTYRRYWVIDIYSDHVIVIDNEDDSLYKVNYTVDNEKDISLDFDMKEKVDIEYIPVKSKSFMMFALDNDKWGTGSKLKLDKSKDAVSDDSWGDVDKTKLRNSVLLASNYKVLVNSVYLHVGEGWENSPSEDLKYPVMQLKGDTLVYNKRAISSALGYAEANDESSVVKKAVALQKKLELSGSGDKGKDYSYKRDGDRVFKDKIDELGGYKYVGESESNVLVYTESTGEYCAIPVENGELNLAEDKIKKFDVIAKFRDNDDVDGVEEIDDEKHKGGKEDDGREFSISALIADIFLSCDNKVKEVTALYEKEKEDREKLEGDIRTHTEDKMMAKLMEFAETVKVDGEMSEDEISAYSEAIKNFASVEDFESHLIVSHFKKHKANKPVQAKPVSFGVYLNPSDEDKEKSDIWDNKYTR